MNFELLKNTENLGTPNKNFKAMQILKKAREVLFPKKKLSGEQTIKTVFYSEYPNIQKLFFDKKYLKENIYNGSHTDYIGDSIRILYSNLVENNIKELRKFLNKIKEIPMTNLASGTLSTESVLKKLRNLKAEPKKYITVDKYSTPSNSAENHFKTDLIDYLKTAENDSTNIIIGGLEDVVVEPIDSDDDIYRHELIKEINRVIPIGGYLVEATSFSRCKIIKDEYGFKKELENIGIERILNAQEFGHRDQGVIYRDIKTKKKDPGKYYLIKNIIEKYSSDLRIEDFGFEKIDNFYDKTFEQLGKTMGIYKKINSILLKTST